MTRSRPMQPKARRRRERIAVVGVVALAAGAGALAAHFGTHRSWENATNPSTSTSNPSVATTSTFNPQGNP